MRFTPMRLNGAFLIDLDHHVDERGFFARSWCATEFADHGLNTEIRQCSVSFNARKGTLRGLHYQAAPSEECKVVRCTSGAIYDVIVDVRATSSTFGQWVGAELTADNRRQLYIPVGIAHGFQTLCDASEVFYQISSDHNPASARGLRWDDPAVRIAWPDAVNAIVSERDRGYSDFDFTSTSS